MRALRVAWKELRRGRERNMYVHSSAWLPKGVSGFGCRALLSQSAVRYPVSEGKA